MTLTLTYLDIPGLAEPIRLALWVGNVPFVDKRVDYAEIARMRASGELPTGQVPVLQLADGSVYSQAGALLRYAGRQAADPCPCLYPPALQLQVDAALETIADLHKSFLPAWYKHALGRHPGTGALFEGTELTAAQMQATLAAINDVIVPARLAQFEYMAVRSGGPFLCGSALTIADLSLFVLVRGLLDGTFCNGVRCTQKTVAQSFPAIILLVDTVAALPAVAARSSSSSSSSSHMKATPVAHGMRHQSSAASATPL